RPPLLKASCRLSYRSWHHWGTPCRILDSDSSGAHLVAAAGFGSIQRLVRTGEKIFSRRHARRWKSGNPHATRQMQIVFGAEVELMLANAFAKTLAEDSR